MELTAFNQTGIMSISGNVYNNGEDALPYVDNQLFFVADGCLRGCSKIRSAI